VALAAGIDGGTAVTEVVTVGSGDVGVEVGAGEVWDSVGSEVGVEEGSDSVGVGLSVGGTAVSVAVGSGAGRRVNVGWGSVGDSAISCGVDWGEGAPQAERVIEARSSMTAENNLACIRTAPLSGNYDIFSLPRKAIRVE
jgi:hypothetical protein